MSQPTHRILVFLKNGNTLVTYDSFEEGEDPENEIVGEIYDRTERFKRIGSLNLDFTDIAGFEVDEISNNRPPVNTAN